MLEANYVWTADGDVSSGGLTAIRLDGFQRTTTLMLQSSTIATTQSFSLQTAQESSGPWMTEASTSVSATATAGVTSQDVIRLTGPYTWVRPRLNSNSTGTYQFRLIAAS